MALLSSDSFREILKGARRQFTFSVSYFLYSLAMDSLTHELVLPLWKSNVSVCLMIDKKAKR